MIQHIHIKNKQRYIWCFDTSYTVLGTVSYVMYMVPQRNDDDDDDDDDDKTLSIHQLILSLL